MVKRIFLIHGWEGNSSNCWFPWLKDGLEDLGFSVFALDMPDTENPKIEPWVSKIKEEVSEVDEETYFVGHSIGCQAILRFLETQERRCGGVFLAAPWMHLNGLESDEEREIAKPWLETPIDFEKVKTKAAGFSCLFSDNDPFVPLSDKEIFESLLGSRISTLHERGHFDKEEFPELLDDIKKGF